MCDQRCTGAFGRSNDDLLRYKTDNLDIGAAVGR